jgi:hypothetical protein
MNFDALISSSMLAPCGMNCSVCYAHLRKKRVCAGCRGEEDSQPPYCRRCSIRNCALNQGIDFCFECSSFPCPVVKRMDQRYRLRYQVSLVEHGLRIRAIGTKRFLSEEKQKWTCTHCAGVVSVHSRVCSDCGKVMEGMG